MQFLPSLLEYSPESLSDKIQTIVDNNKLFLEVTRQKTPQPHLHLDFVQKYFAQDRKVMESLSVQKVLEMVYEKFPKGANLSVHLMGDTEDLLNSFKFFESHTPPENFQLTLLVPVKYYNNWHNQFGLTPGYSVGIWLDKGDWTTFRFMPKVTYLLMTVKAGKSGQKLSDSMLTLAMNTVKTHPDSDFIVDGGWSVDFEAPYKNLSIVSHTSFWQAMS